MATLKKKKKTPLNVTKLESLSKFQCTLKGFKYNYLIYALQGTVYPNLKYKSF